MADKYADWVDEPAADPYAEWADEPAAPEQEKMSAGRAGVLGFAQGGSFGFADEIGGALGKLLLPEPVKVNTAAQAGDSPEALEMKRRIAAEQAADPSTYQMTRDLVRGEAEQARRERPNEYMAGEVGGALATAVLPGGAVGTGARAATTGARIGRAALTGAGIGSAYGLGSSKADLAEGEFGAAALDTGIGGAFGAAGGALGQGVSELGGGIVRRVHDFAKRRVGQADAGLDTLAQEQVQKSLSSASGDLGAVVQQGNRLVENLMRLESTGSLTPAQAQLLSKMKASGQWDELVNRLAQSNLDDLPGKAAEVEARQGVLSQLQGGKDEAFDAARKAVADPMAQVMPRVKRYAAPVAAVLGGGGLGGVVGLAAGGNPVEVGFSALAGAGTRPAVNAVQRMFRHPAVQRPIFAALQRLTQTNPEALGRFAKPLAAAAAKGERELQATSYVLAQRDPEYRDMLKKLETDGAQAER